MVVNHDCLTGECIQRVVACPNFSILLNFWNKHRSKPIQKKFFIHPRAFWTAYWTSKWETPSSIV